MSGTQPTTSAAADALTNAGIRAAVSATPRLRASAMILGWPAPAARALRLKYEGEDLKVTYPDKARQAVEDLEYGTEDRAPLAAIRRFNNRSAKFTDLSFLPSLQDMLEGSQ